MIEKHPEQTELNPALLKECRNTFDWWSQLASSHRGVWLMFGWAFAEATVWPIIPDFLLVPLAVANRQQFWRLFLAAVAGAALGGIFLFLMATWLPGLAWQLLQHVPLVHNRQITEVQEEFATKGINAFVVQPWSGISFKVWAVVGGSQGVNPWLAIPTFVLARAVRMGIFGGLARLIGGWQHRFFRDFSLFVTMFYLLLFFYEWWQIVA